MPWYKPKRNAPPEREYDQRTHLVHIERKMDVIEKKLEFIMKHLNLNYQESDPNIAHSEEPTNQRAYHQPATNPRLSRSLSKATGSKSVPTPRSNSLSKVFEIFNRPLPRSISMSKVFNSNSPTRPALDRGKNKTSLIFTFHSYPPQTFGAISHQSQFK